MRLPALCFALSAAVLSAADFPVPFNSGADKDAKPPMTGEEAVKTIKLPPGFKATLFAGEPDVQNPIACAWDSRGRLWVAENYTYAEASKTFDHSLRDRILVFEDTDNDGRHDKRTVFADNLKNLTSIELGYGGVYATAAPHLLFFPDKNRDDKPDGEPEVLLDGFDAWSIRHNFVNGLKWGPDGWLYGRHGIQATSNVGRPGAPDSERVKINCCIWRFHPVRKSFEVVTWGGTNPWGHDWNAEGEGFFTNTVTGHLYHIIPGAHYERMYGEDLNPHIYQLLPHTADHYHYDTSKSWTESRDGKASDFGGGHAHTGCMIYLGDNWPEEYRGKLFTINLHGRRLNVERLERKGSGYTAKHDGDLFQFTDPWFRGVELTYGPDGGVYILDWSDQGECHENDGVHRTSGRIYKITYGEGKKLRFPSEDFATRKDSELFELARHGNEWTSRQARHEIAIRAASSKLQASPLATVVKEILKETDVRRKLRLTWALHLAEQMRPNGDPPSAENVARRVRVDDAFRGMLPSMAARAGQYTCLPQDARFREVVSELLTSKSEHLQVWGIRLLADWYLDHTSHMEGQLVTVQPFFMRERTHSTDVGMGLWNLTKETKNSFVAMAMLGFAARDHGGEYAPSIQLLDCVLHFATQPMTAEDSVFRTYLWQVIRVGVGDKNFEHRLPWTADPPYSRIAEWPSHPQILENLGRLFASANSEHLKFDGIFFHLQFLPVPRAKAFLEGVHRGLRGVHKTKKPETWDEFEAGVREHPELRDLVRKLNVIFGDGRALDEVRAIVFEGKDDLQTRRQALETLIASKPADLRAICEKLVNHGDLGATAMRGLATFDDPAAAKLAVNHWNHVRSEFRAGVISTFVSRPTFARALLAAVAAGKISRENVTPYHARQIAAFNDADLTAELSKVWGEIRTTPAAKKQRMTELKTALSKDVLAKADIERGRQVFAQTCATCHRLYDLGAEGTQLGPNLTGSGRENIDYLLENIIDPNALVPADYKLSILTMKDGRTLSGFISAQTDQTLTLRTMTDTQTLPKAEVGKTETSPNSLMPEGLLDALSAEHVRDLFGFLMKK